MVHIWKFRIPLSGEIELPEEAEIVHAGPDPAGHTCIWALVDDSQELIKRTFAVLPTGAELPAYPYMAHIRTFVESPLVLHVFEVLE